MASISKTRRDEQDQEIPEDYRKGGYHPVELGDVYNGYRVVRKLGWGYYSTVWLCHDIKNDNFVALKIIKSGKMCTEVAQDEIKLLQKVEKKQYKDRVGSTRIAQLLENFTLDGPNGRHICMVFELYGPDLYSILPRAKYEGLPITMVKVIMKQILQGLHYLHTKCDIIHTDLKPENILLSYSQQYNDQIVKDAVRKLKYNQPMPKSYVCNLAKSHKHKSKITKHKHDKHKTFGHVARRDLNRSEKGSRKPVCRRHRQYTRNSSDQPRQQSSSPSSGSEPADDYTDYLDALVGNTGQCNSSSKIKSEMDNRDTWRTEVHKSSNKPKTNDSSSDSNDESGNTLNKKYSRKGTDSNRKSRKSENRKNTGGKKRHNSAKGNSEENTPSDDDEPYQISIKHRSSKREKELDDSYQHQILNKNKKNRRSTEERKYFEPKESSTSGSEDDYQIQRKRQSSRKTKSSRHHDSGRERSGSSREKYRRRKSKKKHKKGSRKASKDHGRQRKQSGKNKPGKKYKNQKGKDNTSDTSTESTTDDSDSDYDYSEYLRFYKNSNAPDHLPKQPSLQDEHIISADARKFHSTEEPRSTILTTENYGINGMTSNHQTKKGDVVVETKAHPKPALSEPSQIAYSGLEKEPPMPLSSRSGTVDEQHKIISVSAMKDKHCTETVDHANVYHGQYSKSNASKNRSKELTSSVNNVTQVRMNDSVDAVDIKVESSSSQKSLNQEKVMFKLSSSKNAVNSVPILEVQLNQDTDNHVSQAETVDTSSIPAFDASNLVSHSKNKIHGDYLLSSTIQDNDSSAQPSGHSLANAPEGSAIRLGLSPSQSKNLFEQCVTSQEKIISTSITSEEKSYSLMKLENVTKYCETVNQNQEIMVLPTADLKDSLRSVKATKRSCCGLGSSSCLCGRSNKIAPVVEEPEAAQMQIKSSSSSSSSSKGSTGSKTEKKESVGKESFNQDYSIVETKGNDNGKKSDSSSSSGNSSDANESQKSDVAEKRNSQQLQPRISSPKLQKVRLADQNFT